MQTTEPSAFGRWLFFHGLLLFMAVWMLPPELAVPYHQRWGIVDCLCRICRERGMADWGLCRNRQARGSFFVQFEENVPCFAAEALKGWRAMYAFDSRIRYSEVAENGCLSLDGLINYMQDCASFESEDLGVGREHLDKKNRTWVLNFWQIVIGRYPEMGESITIGTQGYGCEKMFGYRNFMLMDEKGDYLAKANSIWVMMDTEKKRPVLVKPEEAEVYGTAEPIAMDYAPRKISIPEGGSVQPSFTVLEYHLDTNHHVNNGQYVRMASAFLPKGAVVAELRAEYKRQAVLGDTVIPVVYEIPKGYLVSLNSADGKPYAVVEFFVGCIP